MKIFEESLGKVSIHPEGEWESDKKYAKLALVHYSSANASFIAKKDVAENIPPDSIQGSEYWVKLSNTIDVSINTQTNTWIINGIDTNVPATGPKGATGNTGPQGPKGDPGDLQNAVGLGFSHTVQYNPNDEYNNHILLKQSDNTDAIGQLPVKETVTEQGYTYYRITAKLKNEVAQKQSVLDAFFPIAIAGKMFINMTSGNCLPIYYCDKVELNPSTGVIKGSNVSIKDPDDKNSYITITDLLTRYIGDIETLLAAL